MSAPQSVPYLVGFRL